MKLVKSTLGASAISTAAVMSLVLPFSYYVSANGTEQTPSVATPQVKTQPAVHSCLASNP